MMGSRRIREIAARLIQAGAPPSRPAAVVESATMPGQRTVRGTLEDIAGKAEDAGIGSPAVIVVGDVVSLAEDLAWLEKGPLRGVTVAVVRDEGATGRLSAALRARGARVLNVAVSRVRPLDDFSHLDSTLRDLDLFEWCVFASGAAVRHVFARLRHLGRDARALAGIGVAAIGPGTAGALRERGIEPDLAPRRYVSEGLVEALLPVLTPGSGVAVFGAMEGRDFVAEALGAAGHRVSQVAAYRNLPVQPSRAALDTLLSGSVGWIALTSSSSARRLIELAEERAVPAATGIACIGPTTAATARELGLLVTRVAEEHTIEGLADCIASAAVGRA